MSYGLAGLVDEGLDLASKIFGHPKDAERKAQADALFARAIQGDVRARVQLECLSGDTSVTVRQQAEAYGLVGPAEGPCGYATETARQYAQLLVSRLASAGTMRSSAGVFGGMPSWLWLGALGAAVLMVARGRKH